MESDAPTKSPCENLGISIIFGFMTGSIGGFVREFWYQIPGGPSSTLSPAVRYTRIANSMAKTSMTVATVTALFTLTTCSASIFRSEIDSYNYGLGGAAAAILVSLPSKRVHTSVTSAVFGGIAGTLGGYVSTLFYEKEIEIKESLVKKFAYLNRTDSEKK